MGMEWPVFSNKTLFCLLIITLFTSFFFARSVVVRERWIVPTFLSNSPHQDGAGQQLSYANNWLREGVFNLRLGLYWYPPSVEMPTLDKRGFHASFPPGATIPVYILLKALDLTGIIPDIYEKRSTQLLLVIFLNYFLHFLLALVLCLISFVVCQKIGFDHINSTLLAIVPAIIQFHNANSLYWHHLPFYHHTVVMLPFALYILLELLRIAYPSLPALSAVRIMQPILMFWGMLTVWIFVFIILTIYVMRIKRKEIALPNSWQQGLRWMKQSFLFFSPALAAVAVWGYQVAYYFQNISHKGLFTAATSSQGLTLLDNVLYRMGMSDGFIQYISYLKTSLYDHVYQGYGISGLLMLYATAYLVIRVQKFTSTDGFTTNFATTTHIMLFVPCIAYHLFFAHNYADHKFSSLLFSSVLSMSFVLAPIFIMQIMRKSYFMPGLTLINGKNITIAALLALGSSIMYVYIQIYNEQSVTKMFSPPAYRHVIIGTFIRRNTEYRDVVFSNDYCSHSRYRTLERHFTNKAIHCAANIDDMYQKIKEIGENFTIKVLYTNDHKTHADKIDCLLTAHNISTSWIKKKEVGGLLVFNGKEFRSWYKQTPLTPEICGWGDIPVDE